MCFFITVYKAAQEWVECIEPTGDFHSKIDCDRYLGKDAVDDNFEGKRCYPTASTRAVQDEIVYGSFLRHATLAMHTRRPFHLSDAGRTRVVFSIKVGRHGFNSRPPFV